LEIGNFKLPEREACFVLQYSFFNFQFEMERSDKRP